MSFRPQFISIVFITSILATCTVALASTDSPPQGIWAFVYKYEHGAVPQNYGATGMQESLNVDATLGSNIVRGLSPGASSALDQLAAVDPALADNLNLGTVDLHPKVDVEANGFGLAYGITDKWMVAGGLPVMKATVDINGGFENSTSLSNTINALNSYAANLGNPAPQRANASLLAQVLAGLPQMKGEYLQGALVNDYGYKPIGSSTISGVGDLDVFTQYKFIDKDSYKQAVKLGQVIPTGPYEDPNNLVDVPFGTGYTSTYIETIHDFIFWQPHNIMASVVGHAQYNWAATHDFRLIPSEDFPITTEQENIHYKPGNAYGAGVELSGDITEALKVGVSYDYKEKEIDQIQGKDPTYDYSVLADETNSYSYTLGSSITYSTVPAFKRQQFPLPLTVGMDGSTVLKGKNTQQLNILGATLMVFF